MSQPTFEDQYQAASQEAVKFAQKAHHHNTQISATPDEVMAIAQIALVYATVAQAAATAMTTELRPLRDIDC